MRTVSGRSRASRVFVAKPDQSRFEVLALAFMLTMIISVCLAWYYQLSKPIGCQTSPLFFRFGGEAEATMLLRSNARCPVFVHTGSAVLDDPITIVEPANGALTPRGRTGFYYRPHQNFTGQDYFAIVLNGKTATQAGHMTVRVNVVVQ